MNSQIYNTSASYYDDNPPCYKKMENKSFLESMSKRNKSPISILNELIQHNKCFEKFLISENKTGYIGWIKMIQKNFMISASSVNENKADAKLDIAIQLIAHLTGMRKYEVVKLIEFKQPR